jgi:hypothetical protein
LFVVVVVINEVERWMDRACSMAPTMVLWRTCNHYIDRWIKNRYNGDVLYDYRMRELDQIAIDILLDIRLKRRCHNIFIFDLYRITKSRPDLSSDGHHFPAASPLFGLLAHNAVRLWLNHSFPPRELPGPF